jgi:hypothetical protein
VARVPHLGGCGLSRPEEKAVAAPRSFDEVLAVSPFSMDRILLSSHYYVSRRCYVISLPFIDKLAELYVSFPDDNLSAWKRMYQCRWAIKTASYIDHKVHRAGRSVWK